MSEAQVEQRQQSGAVLLVLVGLGIAFALLVALLAAAKAHTGPIYGEANMLYAALVLYTGAATLYMGYGVTGIERYVNTATALTALGFLANTAAVAHRWSVAGRPPFSNMYEMLLSFVWTLALLTLIAERAYKVKIIGSITMPITVVSVILMQLLPSDVRPLVPALQSTWLQVHVTLAMLSYAACAVSFALAIMFLVQDGMKSEAFQALTSTGMIAIYAAMLFTRFRGGALAVGEDRRAVGQVIVRYGRVVTKISKAVIASEAKQSISQPKGRMDCFVASLLAMTGNGHMLFRQILVEPT